MTIQIKQYTVEADRETGEWLTEPEYVGMVDFDEWANKPDTDEAHFDFYSVEHPDDGDRKVQRAIEVVWR